MPNLQTESYFSSVPDLSSSRSIFKRPQTLKTSFNAGEVIPIYLDVLYPGDTVQIETSKIVRLQTMLTPVYDNLYLDTYFFFVPMRLVWTHTKEFFGENTQSPWVSPVQYQIPSISSPQNGFSTGSLADYFGLPINTVWDNQAEGRPMALPFRAYAKIIDHYFRDENIDDPLNIPVGDTNQTGTNGSNYINDIANGGKPFIARRYHDYFSSCSPMPQKSIYSPNGEAVTFPLIAGTKAPVGAGDISDTAETIFGKHSIAFGRTDGNAFGNANQKFPVFGQVDSGDTKKAFSVVNNTASTASGWSNIYPTNLWADLSSTVGSVTVNQLRMAILLQSFYERLAVTGTRYGELILGIFGVSNPDSRLQDPEYLGGNRIALNVNEVINQAQATNDYLGDLGAMSRTVDSHYDVDFSATEHGFLIGVCCVRWDSTTQQGLAKFWNRLNPLEWYNPYFANLGLMPVYDYEIYADANTMATKTIFGYNEAWADLRYAGTQNHVTGEMRSGIANSLASWHFADYYSQKPTLSSSWLAMDKTNVDRCLAVQSSNANQLFADFYFDCTYTRVLPMYSIPSFNTHF